MIALLVIGVLLGVGAIIAIRPHRDQFLRVWRPTLWFWRVLRLVSLVGIAAALFVSGRFILQLLGVIIVGFGVVYVWIEEPHEKLT